jgi:thioester reductase-like protein
MAADALLPDDIVPSGTPAAHPRTALLTGVTGFLGRYVARELLRTTSLTLVCVARADSAAAARARVVAALAGVGVTASELDGRVEVQQGDVAAPRLGLLPQVYAALAQRTDAVYHCAAEVNWARTYRQLRRTNVAGTLELIRFACLGRSKHLSFVSTIAVCYARNGPERIDEHTAMLPYVERMPLGYAQSKCVAESLLGAAAERGLPVTILRPALICGDTRTGESNLGDLIAALVEGCSAVGSAIDVDWLMDCVPVDFVARVLACLPVTDDAGLRVLHLAHDRARHWREVVLWMHLYGRPMKLLSTPEWIDRAFTRGGAAGTRLRGYRRFFQGVGHTADTVRPFETYLAPQQRRIDSGRTADLLARLGLAIPPLDAPLLHRYFAHYGAAGLLPSNAAYPREQEPMPAAAFTALLQRRWGLPELEVTSAQVQPFASVNGVLNEISSIRLGSHVGLARYQLSVRRPGMRALDLAVLVKTKARDVAMQRITVDLAALCDERLAVLFERFQDDLGLARSHQRELALYEIADARLRRNTPRCYGTLSDEAQQTWSVVLEYVGAAEWSNTGDWSDAGIETAVRGVAAIHAIWYAREDALRAMPWLAPEPTRSRMVEMSPLWHALRDYAARWFRGWGGDDLHTLHAELIDTIGDWWPQLDALPRTLVHNDFNPRNLTLRKTATGLCLCAFDWELAGIGVPQHDLAELLCFVGGRLDAVRLTRLLELHRHHLERESGREIDPAMWRAGFALALQHLLVDRLPMYALIHRFRPQVFLPQVVRNWLHLFRIARRYA